MSIHLDGNQSDHSSQINTTDTSSSISGVKVSVKPGSPKQADLASCISRASTKSLNQAKANKKAEDSTSLSDHDFDTIHSSDLDDDVTMEKLDSTSISSTSSSESDIKKLGYDPTDKVSVAAFMKNPANRASIKQIDGSYVYIEKRRDGVTSFLYVPNKDWSRATSLNIKLKKTNQALESEMQVDKAIRAFVGLMKPTVSRWNTKTQDHITGKLIRKYGSETGVEKEDVNFNQVVIQFKSKRVSVYSNFHRNEELGKMLAHLKFGTEVQIKDPDYWKDFPNWETPDWDDDNLSTKSTSTGTDATTSIESDTDTDPSVHDDYHYDLETKGSKDQTTISTGTDTDIDAAELSRKNVETKIANIKQSPVKGEKGNTPGSNISFHDGSNDIFNHPIQNVQNHFYTTIEKNDDLQPGLKDLQSDFSQVSPNRKSFGNDCDLSRPLVNGDVAFSDLKQAIQNTQQQIGNISAPISASCSQTNSDDPLMKQMDSLKSDLQSQSEKVFSHADTSFKALNAILEHLENPQSLASTQDLRDKLGQALQDTDSAFDLLTEQLNHTKEVLNLLKPEIEESTADGVKSSAADLAATSQDIYSAATNAMKSLHNLLKSVSHKIDIEDTKAAEALLAAKAAAQAKQKLDTKIQGIGVSPARNGNIAAERAKIDNSDLFNDDSPKVFNNPVNSAINSLDDTINKTSTSISGSLESLSSQFKTPSEATFNLDLGSVVDSSKIASEQDAPFSDIAKMLSDTKQGIKDIQGKIATACAAANDPSSDLVMKQIESLKSDLQLQADSVLKDCDSTLDVLNNINTNLENGSLPASLNDLRTQLGKCLQKLELSTKTLDDQQLHLDSVLKTLEPEITNSAELSKAASDLVKTSVAVHSSTGNAISAVKNMLASVSNKLDSVSAKKDAADAASKKAAALAAYNAKLAQLKAAMSKKDDPVDSTSALDTSLQSLDDGSSLIFNPSLKQVIQSTTQNASPDKLNAILGNLTTLFTSNSGSVDLGNVFGDILALDNQSLDDLIETINKLKSDASTLSDSITKSSKPSNSTDPFIKLVDKTKSNLDAQSSIVLDDYKACLTHLLFAIDAAKGNSTETPSVIRNLIARSVKKLNNSHAVLSKKLESTAIELTKFAPEIKDSEEKLTAAGDLAALCFGINQKCGNAIMSLDVVSNAIADATDNKIAETAAKDAADAQQKLEDKLKELKTSPAKNGNIAAERSKIDNTDSFNDGSLKVFNDPINAAIQDLEDTALDASVSILTPKFNKPTAATANLSFGSLTDTSKIAADQDPSFDDIEKILTATKDGIKDIQNKMATACAASTDPSSDLVMKQLGSLKSDLQLQADAVLKDCDAALDAIGNINQSLENGSLETSLNDLRTKLGRSLQKLDLSTKTLDDQQKYLSSVLADLEPEISNSEDLSNAASDLVKISSEINTSTGEAISTVQNMLKSMSKKLDSSAKKAADKAKAKEEEKAKAKAAEEAKAKLAAETQAKVAAEAKAAAEAQAKSAAEAEAKAAAEAQAKAAEKEALQTAAKAAAVAQAKAAEKEAAAKAASEAKAKAAEKEAAAKAASEAKAKTAEKEAAAKAASEAKAKAAEKEAAAKAASEAKAKAAAKTSAAIPAKKRNPLFDSKPVINAIKGLETSLKNNSIVSNNSTAISLDLLNDLGNSSGDEKGSTPVATLKTFNENVKLANTTLKNNTTQENKTITSSGPSEAHPTVKSDILALKKQIAAAQKQLVALGNSININKDGKQDSLLGELKTLSTNNIETASLTTNSLTLALNSLEMALDVKTPITVLKRKSILDTMGSLTLNLNLQNKTISESSKQLANLNKGNGSAEANSNLAVGINETKELCNKINIIKDSLIAEFGKIMSKTDTIFN